jgi:hypothetical protein
MRHKAPKSPREAIEALRHVLHMIENYPQPHLEPHTLLELERQTRQRIESLEAALAGVPVG